MNKQILLACLIVAQWCMAAVAQDATIGPEPEIQLPKEGASFSNVVPISVSLGWGSSSWLTQTYYKGVDPNTIMITPRQEVTWCPPPAPPGGGWAPACKTISFGGQQFSAAQMNALGHLDLSGNAAGFASLLGIQSADGKYTYRVQFSYSASGRQAAQPSPWSKPRAFTINTIKSITRGGITVNSNQQKPLNLGTAAASSLGAPTIERPREQEVLSSSLGPFYLTVRPSAAAKNYCPAGNYEYACQYAPPTKSGEWPQFGNCTFSGLLDCDSAEQTKSFPIIDTTQNFKPGQYKLKVRHRKNGNLGAWSAERNFTIVQSNTGGIPVPGEQNGFGTQRPSNAEANIAPLTNPPIPKTAPTVPTTNGTPTAPTQKNSPTAPRFSLPPAK